MNILYIVMPAYNERENIEYVIETWYPILKNKDIKSKLIIADSGSNDNTHEILLELQKKFPRIEILSNTGKTHGEKVIALYKYAIDFQADYVFQTDSDGQTEPKDFSFFWDNKDKYDIICGNRINRGDGFLRTIIEKIVCILLYLFFNVEIPDANAPFRFMKANVLKKYIKYIPINNAIPNVILTMLFVYNKENVFFKEISFYQRLKGKNTINIYNIIKIGLESLKDFKKLRFKIKKNNKCI
mgnify:CR=1 FL=1